MKLTAIFETWHISDGNYPPLAVDSEVRLAFQISLPGIHLNLAEMDDDEQDQFEHHELAEYSFCARLVRVYEQPPEIPLGIFETNGFRFYIEHTEVPSLRRGRRYSGTGSLLLDYYIWTEFLENYDDPPDLFFNLRVTRILRASIPERFIRRTKNAIGLPTRVSNAELSKNDISEVSSMVEHGSGFGFYVLDLDGTGLEDKSIPVTFRLH
jgi:hypothetical protein